MIIESLSRWRSLAISVLALSGCAMTSAYAPGYLAAADVARAGLGKLAGAAAQ